MQRVSRSAVADRLPVAAEQFHEDVPHRLCILVMRVELASTFGLAHVDPVGSAVGSS